MRFLLSDVIFGSFLAVLTEAVLTSHYRDFLFRDWAWESKTFSTPRSFYLIRLLTRILHPDHFESILVQASH